MSTVKIKNIRYGNVNEVSEVTARILLADPANYVLVETENKTVSDAVRSFEKTTPSDTFNDNPNETKSKSKTQTQA